MSKQNNEDIWVVCPECETKLKKEHIGSHMIHVHNKKIKDVDESSIKVLPMKELKQKIPTEPAVLFQQQLLLILQKDCPSSRQLRTQKILLPPPSGVL
jgi:hypothetical protein